jgi:GAF domain-containing protein
MTDSSPASKSLTAIAQEAQTLINAETTVVALAEAEGNTVFYAAAVGKHASAIVGKRSTVETSGLCGAAFASGQGELVCQVEHDVRVRQDIAEALGITTALAVPILNGGELKGALMVLNRQDGSAYDEAAKQQLTDFAQGIAL